jgi:hypothetical protein
MHLTFWTAGRDDPRRLPDQGLRADLLRLAPNPSVPEEQLTEEEDEGACRAHHVPRPGKYEQQDDPDEEEHAKSLIRPPDQKRQKTVTRKQRAGIRP